MSLELERELLTETRPENIWQEGWTPTTPDEAAWVLEQYRTVQGEIRSVDEFVERKVREIYAWYDRRTRALRDTADRMSNLLEKYARNSGRKTINLPGGELKLRKQQPQFERRDDALLEFLRASELGHYIKAVEEPDWQALKADCQVVGTNLVLPDGQVIEGVTVHTPEEPAFSVKLEAESEDSA